MINQRIKRASVQTETEAANKGREQRTVCRGLVSPERGKRPQSILDVITPGKQRIEAHRRRRKIMTKQTSVHLDIRD